MKLTARHAKRQPRSLAWLWLVPVALLPVWAAALGWDAIQLRADATQLPDHATATSPSYPAPGDSLNCSGTTVATGTDFDCTIGADNGDDVTLTVTSSGANASIAGAVSLTKTITSGYQQTFTVTAPTDAGTLAISSAINGVAADSTTVLVTATATATGTDSTIASTGAESTGLALGAGGLLVVGAGVVVFAARRRSTHNA